MSQAIILDPTSLNCQSAANADRLTTNKAVADHSATALVDFPSIQISVVSVLWIGFLDVFAAIRILLR